MALGVPEEEHASPYSQHVGGYHVMEKARYLNIFQIKKNGVKVIQPPHHHVGFGDPAVLGEILKQRHHELKTAIPVAQ